MKKCLLNSQFAGGKKEYFWLHSAYPKVHSLAFPFSVHRVRKKEEMAEDGAEASLGLLVNGLVSRITVASGKYELVCFLLKVA